MLPLLSPKLSLVFSPMSGTANSPLGGGGGVVGSGMWSRAAVTFFSTGVTGSCGARVGVVGVVGEPLVGGDPCLFATPAARVGLVEGEEPGPGVSGALSKKVVKGGPRAAGTLKWCFPTQTIRWNATQNSLDVRRLSLSASDSTLCV